MHIRPITPKDDAPLQAIIKINLEQHDLALPGTAYDDPELGHLSSYYATHQPSQYFVLVDDTDQVYGGIGVAPFEQTHQIAELQKLYIAPSAQEQGYSKLLLDVAITFASANFTALYLETHTNLQVALRLYDQYAFTRLAGPLAGSAHSTMNVWMLKRFA